MSKKGAAKKNLKAAKAARLEEILGDDELSSFDKLSTISEEGLWGYSDSINHEFREWENEAKNLEQKEAGEGYASGMTDSIFSPSHMRHEKREQVDYSEALTRILESAGEDENPMVTVVTTRNPRVSIKKSFNEVADKLLEYCKDYEVIGFVNDW